jgi:hypothetical protein
MSNFYHMQLEVRVRCECCNERVMVKVTDVLDCEEENLYDLDCQIKEALETQQADDGWLNDFCPRCHKNHTRQFAKEQDADDFCSRDKSEDIY